MTVRTPVSPETSLRAARDPAVYRAAGEYLAERELTKGVLLKGLSDEQWDAMKRAAPDWDTAQEATGACIMGALLVGAVRCGYSPAELDWIPMLIPAKEMMYLPRSPNFWNNQRDVTKQDVLEALSRGARAR